MNIPAYLTLPAGRDPQNLPLIVMPHGGPQARDMPGFVVEAHAVRTETAAQIIMVCFFIAHSLSCGTTTVEHCPNAVNF